MTETLRQAFSFESRDTEAEETHIYTLKMGFLERPLLKSNNVVQCVLQRNSTASSSQ